ncbi:MAG: PD40 domain-containing protein [Actinobacteria bacterium]|nr:PD40 domain-containing protein [Actinomycetota bacterium]
MWRLLIALVAGIALFAPAPEGSGGTGNPLLAFSSGGSIHTIALDGSGRRLLIRRAYSPSWSPDGSRLAFVSSRSGDEELYVARADGSKIKRLTRIPGPDLSPTWSSDGRRLAWSRNREIWTMGVSGTNKRRVVAKTQIWHEHHSPTWHGRTIVYSSNRVSTFNPELYAVPAKRLTFTKGSDGVLGDDGMPDFSPDGRRIVFTSNRDQNGEIYVMDADGSDQRRLTRKTGDDFTPRFSPDGRRIAFTSLPGSLFVMNADGTGLRRLASGTDPDWRP